MKRGILVLVASSVLLLAAAPAFAAGPYVGLEGGVLWLSDASVSYSGVNQGDIKFDTGWGIGAVGGYDFGTWRLEGELAYRSSGTKEFSGASGTDPLDGDGTATALMVNAFYDFKTLSKSVYPYIGAGIGGASVAADIKDSSGVQQVDDDEIVFAYQFIAGVAFPVSKELAIDLNYRYFATTDPKLKDSFGDEFETEYSSHNIFVGLRYNF